MIIYSVIDINLPSVYSYIVCYSSYMYMCTGMAPNERNACAHYARAAASCERRR